MTSDAKPAEALIGLVLENDWTVERLIPRSDDATGGSFSIAYEVRRQNGTVDERAFLKALDFTVVAQMGMPIADRANLVTEAYVFERNLVLRCAGHGMSNVVRAFDAGQVTVDPGAVGPQYAFLTDVPYIIFEMADGDVRSVVAEERLFDHSWALRVLHGVANGLRQLHQAGIAHQDVKPSNVMTFGLVSKVGDLGRASSQEGGVFDGEPIAGDLTYAPPELLYGELHADQRVRRRSVDMYHLASMGSSCILRGPRWTPLIAAELDPAFHWRTWPRDYRNVLPYVREAFDRVMTQMAEFVDSSWGSELISTLRELGDPDPFVRGNSRVPEGPLRYALERYVSIFDRLARDAEIQLRRGLH